MQLDGLWHTPYGRFGMQQFGLAGVVALDRRTGGLLTVLWLRLIVCRCRSQRHRF